MSSVLISASFQPFVEREVSSGKFRTPAEVVEAGLRLLQDRERRLEALRDEIQEGLESLDDGQGILLPDETAQRDFFEAIKSEGRAALKGQTT